MSLSGQGFQTAVLSNTSFHCTLVGRDHKSKRRIPVLALLKLENHFGTGTDRLQEVQHVTLRGTASLRLRLFANEKEERLASRLHGYRDRPGREEEKLVW